MLGLMRGHEETEWGSHLLTIRSCDREWQRRSASDWLVQVLLQVCLQNSMQAIRA